MHYKIPSWFCAAHTHKSESVQIESTRNPRGLNKWTSEKVNSRTRGGGLWCERCTVDTVSCRLVHKHELKHQKCITWIAPQVKARGVHMVGWVEQRQHQDAELRILTFVYYLPKCPVLIDTLQLNNFNSKTLTVVGRELWTVCVPRSHFGSRLS